jgi:hypothetical protein
MFLDLHLKLRSQTEAITALAREIAIANSLAEVTRRGMIGSSTSTRTPDLRA